jgi:hypothetical protein
MGRQLRSSVESVWSDLEGGEEQHRGRYFLRGWIRKLLEMLHFSGHRSFRIHPRKNETTSSSSPSHASNHPSSALSTTSPPYPLHDAAVVQELITAAPSFVGGPPPPPIPPPCQLLYQIRVAPRRKPRHWSPKSVWWGVVRATRAEMQRCS